MPRKKTPYFDNDFDPNAEPTPQIDDNSHSMEEISTVESEDIIDLAEYYGDGTDNIRVQLYRKEPTHLDGVRIDGFLQYLTPGDNIGDIQIKYGGGLFEIRQLTGNKWSKMKRFRIGGLPRLPAPAEASAPKADISPEKYNITQESKPLPSTVTVDGIPIGGSTQEFLSTMERIAMYRAMFPPQKDINGDLLQLIIAQSGRGQNGLNIKEIAETVSVIKELAGTMSGEGGSDWKEVLKEGFSAFRSWMETVKTAPVRNPAGLIPAKTTHRPPQPAPEIGQKQPETRPQDTIKEESDMSIQTVAEKACATIVTGFMANPQQTPIEVNQALQVTLPAMAPATRDVIKSFKDQLYQASRNLLTAEYDIEPEEIEKFRLFFDDTFNIFVS